MGEPVNPSGGNLDRTAAAVMRQLEAMGCDRVEVGIREQESGQMMNRTWSRAEIQARLPWLKRMNARGNDIYVRPAVGDPGADLVLVDDLTRDRVERMGCDGVTPALLVETSPGNFQAWVRLPGTPSDAVRGEVARELARTYEGDPASADARHYGRLAGFTNRKPKYERAGLQPWVLLRAASGRTARGGESLVRAAEGRLSGRATTGATPPAPVASPDRTSRAADPVSLYREVISSLLPRAPVAARADGAEKLDYSWCDIRAAGVLARAGCSPDQIADAIRKASPQLEERKRGHVEDYVQRTVQAVLRSGSPPNRARRCST